MKPCDVAPSISLLFSIMNKHVKNDMIRDKIYSLKYTPNLIVRHGGGWLLHAST